MVMPLPATDSDADDDRIRGCKKQNQSKMYLIGRELCFIFAIAFTTYAAVTNSESNSGRGPTPTPFFRRGSLVADFYKGEFNEAVSRAADNDLTFVMYYAPWDAESQIVRWEFEALARLYYKQIFFVGINCWQPGSSCRRTLSKVQQFPKLVAYLLHESGVEYKGPRDVQHMAKFLDAMMRPIYRIQTNQELLKLRSLHNAVVVAYVNFVGVLGGNTYRTLYETSLKFIERGMRREVAFAVVTNEVSAQEMGVLSTPTIKMYLWNETQEYTGENVADALTQWVLTHLHQVTVWLTPPGVKSLTIAPYINEGPVMLMFTPSDNTISYDLLREVGLDYYNCNKSPTVSALARYIANDALEKISTVKRLETICAKRQRKLSLDSVDIPVQIVGHAWSNGSCVRGKKQASWTTWSSWAGSSSCHTETEISCRVRDNLATTWKDKGKRIVTSMLTGENDPLSAAALIRSYWHDICQRHRLLKFDITEMSEDDLSSSPNPALFGLACHSNKTVSLLSMDSDQYGHFAAGLGVDLSRHKHRTAVIILNSEMETLHVLKGEVNRLSLTKFLLDYTAGHVERFLRSERRTSHTLNRYKPPTNQSTMISLAELTSRTFHRVVLNNSQNVVLLYHSPYCAFCHGIAYVYLTVARLLHNIKDLVFARIDGENNDLPWQYTVHRYPSVLFFPANRKEDSRIFSQKLPFTVNNLVQFVLANLNLEDRLLGMLYMCNRWGNSEFSDKRRECVVSVQHACLDAISDTLSEYRAVSTRLQYPVLLKQKRLRELLERLQYLKKLHLYLGMSNNKENANLVTEFIEEFNSNNDNKKASVLTKAINGYKKDEL